MSSSESEDDDRRFNDEEDENGDIKDEPTAKDASKPGSSSSSSGPGGETHLTSLLFGNIDREGRLDGADGEDDYLGAEIRAKLGGLQRLLGGTEELQLDEDKSEVRTEVMCLF